LQDGLDEWGKQKDQLGGVLSQVKVNPARTRACG
jgi:hypothetical protein